MRPLTFNKAVALHLSPWFLKTRYLLYLDLVIESSFFKIATKLACPDISCQKREGLVGLSGHYGVSDCLRDGL